jgi:predicted AlkP superfamily pyrophosphatase or phosphodiesterase
MSTLVNVGFKCTHFRNIDPNTMQSTLRAVDIFAKDLHTALKDRNLTDIVDVVFVSDHGMTDTSHPELIYMDDILGDGFNKIEHEDGISLPTPHYASFNSD